MAQQFDEWMEEKKSGKSPERGGCTQWTCGIKTFALVDVNFTLSNPATDNWMDIAPPVLSGVCFPLDCMPNGEKYIIQLRSSSVKLRQSQTHFFLLSFFFLFTQRKTVFIFRMGSKSISLWHHSFFKNSHFLLIHCVSCAKCYHVFGGGINKMRHLFGQCCIRHEYIK